MCNTGEEIRTQSIRFFDQFIVLLTLTVRIHQHSDQKDGQKEGEKSTQEDKLGSLLFHLACLLYFFKFFLGFASFILEACFLYAADLVCNGHAIAQCLAQTKYIEGFFVLLFSLEVIVFEIVYFYQM